MDSLEPKSIDQWNDWLENNHDASDSIWLILAKKDSGLPYIAVSDAIDMALCYGWIDSLPNKLDSKRFKLRFSPRNPKSNWSRVNKEKVEHLITEKRMKPPGLEMIALAKETGTWTALDDVENLSIPDDLAKEFEKYKNAREHFEAYPKSVKRNILEWLFNAKRADTREKRLIEIADKADKNIRANQYK